MENKTEDKTESKVAKKRGKECTYDPDLHPQLAERICGELGAHDKKLAMVFGIHLRTLTGWKSKYPELKEAIRRGVDDFDSNVVEKSLFKRAVGFEYEETVKKPGKNGKLAVDKVILKTVIPDVAAIIFWLKNRQRTRWKERQEVDVDLNVVRELTEEEKRIAEAFAQSRREKIMQEHKHNVLMLKNGKG